MPEKYSWPIEQTKRWEMQLPPSRPSKSELAVWEKYIKLTNKKRDPRILILGSTPEFRDLVHKYKIVPTIVDFSKESYKEMTKLCKRKGEEIFVLSDWRNIDLKEKFDLVMGDLAFTVLLEDFVDFLPVLESLLKDNGITLQRVFVKYPQDKDKYKDLEKIFINYRKLKNPLHIITALEYPLWLHFYDEKEYTREDKVIKALVKLFKSGKITKKELMEFCKRRKGDTFKVYIPYKSFVDKQLKKYFNIVKIEYGQDWFRRYTPIYLLKKK